MSATVQEDWSDLESAEPKLADSDVMPRLGTTRRASNASGGTGRGRTSKAKRLESLESQLSRQMFQAGGMIALGLPVTGTYVCQQAEAFPEAIIQLAARRPEWIEALEHVAEVAPGITIGRTVLGIAAAMGTDRYHRTEGKTGYDPDKRAAMFLGVTAAYYAVYPKEGGNAPSAGIISEPPAAFHPVS